VVLQVVNDTICAKPSAIHSTSTARSAPNLARGGEQEQPGGPRRRAGPHHSERVAATEALHRRARPHTLHCPDPSDAIQ